MKNSGIEWIGLIPDKWNLSKIGQLFNLRNEKVSDKVYQPLSVSKSGVVPQMSSVAKSDASDDRKLVLAGDFVINSRSDRKTSCGVAKVNGSVSLINTILYSKNKVSIYNDYMNYLLKNYGFAEEFYRWGHGIVADLWTTSWQEMKNIIIPLPQLDVQKKIYYFLNEKSFEIESLIENEKKQIDKLIDYKKIAINDAVTKGLDNEILLKDSGIKWIGMMPNDWELKKAKFLATQFTKGTGITKEDVVLNGDTPCVRYGEIYTKYDNYFKECITKTNVKNISSPTYFEKGDILFTCTGELVEEIGKNVMYFGNEKCLAGGDIIVMKHNQEPRYLNYAMNSISSQNQKSYGKTKLKVVHTSLSQIGNVFVCVPPLNVQEKIADYLDLLTNSINRIIEIKNKKIELLECYKKSLIYEYITGKKEVI